MPHNHPQRITCFVLFGRAWFTERTSNKECNKVKIRVEAELDNVLQMGAISFVCSQVVQCIRKAHMELVTLLSVKSI